MAVKSSGSLSFDEIKNEFGFPPDNKFGNYRISKTVGQMTNLPLDSGVPQSGSIKFSDFYNKKQNIIVKIMIKHRDLNMKENKLLQQAKIHQKKQLIYSITLPPHLII